MSASSQTEVAPSQPAPAASPPSISKVVVLFVSIGDAPKLIQSKFKIGGSERFVRVVNFLRKQLSRETVFVYINNAFVPNQDELVWDLFVNFGRDGKLIVNYASSMAWG